MNLVASLIVRNELDRYLKECVESLLGFCDGIRVLNDGSDDGSDEWLVQRSDRIKVADLASTTFFEHEGRSRQVLLEWTLDAHPTHVLAIDADELVADGAAVRRACSSPMQAWTLEMEEVWELDGDCLCIREDGGWRAHPVAMLWRVPPRHLDRRWRILDRALACGRIPVAAGAGRIGSTGTQILHFGWANRADRVARHERYAVADGGRFHASAHLDSILWPDDRVELRGRTWPRELAPLRPAVTERALRERPTGTLPS